MKIVTQQNWLGLYQAIDEDSYDGSPDSPTRHQVGLGSTPERAIADLMAEIEMDEELILTRREHLRDKHG